MLASAAKEMVSGWKFIHHDPVEFPLTIQFILSTAETRKSDVVRFDMEDKIIINGYRTKN